MSINFAGMGFSFGARDMGLRATQESIHEGFVQIRDIVPEVRAELNSLGFDLAEAAEQGLSDALQDTADVLDDDLSGGFDKAGDAAVASAEGAERSYMKVAPVLDTVWEAQKKVVEALKATIEKVDPLQRLEDVIGGLKEKTVEWAGSLGRIPGAIKKLGIDPLVGRIQALSGAITGGLNLTNSLEGEMTSLSKEARALGANYGYTGRELDEFKSKAASTAYSLRTSAAVTGEAIFAADQMGEELLSALNLTDKSLAKLQESVGVNADTIRSSTMRMRNEIGLEAEAIDRIVDSVTAMGQETGDVGAALNSLPDLTEKLAARKALGATTEELEDYAKGIAATQAGLFEFSQSSDQARQMGLELAETLNESRKGFQGMFAGVNDQLPQFTSQMQKMFGTDMAFESMTKSPEEFLASMSELVSAQGGFSELSAEQANFVKRHMEEAFGQAAPTMIQFLEQADDKTLQMMASVREAKIDLGELADEAHSTGLTLADRFDRATARFETSFRRIGRPAVRDFVSDSSEQLNKFSGRLQEIAEEGGPLGAVVTKLSEAHQMGVLAFVPEELRGYAVALESVAKQAGPAAIALGQMGFKLSTLKNPLTIITGLTVGLGTWFLSLTEGGMSTSEALDHMAATIKDKLITAWEMLQEIAPKVWDAVTDAVETGANKVADFFNSISGEEVAKRVVKGLKAVGGAILGFFRDLPAMIRGEAGRLSDPNATGVGPALVRMFKAAGGFVADFAAEIWRTIRDIDWASAFQTFVDTLTELRGQAVDLIKSGVAKIGEMLSRIPWDKVGDFAAMAFVKVGEAFAAAVTQILDLVSSLFTTAAEAASKINWGEVGAAIGKGVTGAIRATLNIVKVAQEKLDTFRAWASGVDVNKAFKDFAANAWDAIVGFMTNVDWGDAFDLYKSLGSLIGDVGLMIIDFFGEVLKFVVIKLPMMVFETISLGIIKGIGWVVGKVFGKEVGQKFTRGASRLVSSMMDGFKTAWEGLFDLVTGLVKGLFFIFNPVNWPNIGAKIVNFIVGGLEGAWNKLKEWFTSALDWIRGLFPFSPPEHGPLADIMDWGSNMVDALLGGLKAAWDGITGFFTGALGALADMFTEFFGWAGEKLGQLVSDTMRAAGDVQDLVTGEVQGGRADLTAVGSDEGDVAAVKAFQKHGFLKGVKISTEIDNSAMQKASDQISRMTAAQKKQFTDLFQTRIKQGMEANKARVQAAQMVTQMNQKLGEQRDRYRQIGASTQAMSMKVQAAGMAVGNQQESFEQLAQKAMMFNTELGKSVQLEGQAVAESRTLKSTFDSIFSEESLQGLLGYFDSLWAGVSKSFGAIEEAAVNLFGNSISTDVKKDFEESNEAVTGFLTNLETGMRETVKKALIQAFKTATNKIQETTKEFITGELELFKGFVDKVIDHFDRMTLRVLELTDKTVRAMMADITSVSDDLFSMERALVRVSEAEARLATTRVNKQTAAEAAKRPLDLEGKDPQRVMIQAVHLPRWYMEIADKKLDAMIGVLKQVVSLLQGGGSTPRGTQRQTNSALEYQRRTQSEGGAVGINGGPVGG